MKSRTKRPESDLLPEGVIQFSAGQTLHGAVRQIAAKWGCSIEEASRRVMIMALSGWKLKFAGYMSGLSEFCSDQVEPFQTTCLTLRNWLVQHEVGIEESLSDPDVQARLEMILDALQEKKKDGVKADLAAILAEDDSDDPY